MSDVWTLQRYFEAAGIGEKFPQAEKIIIKADDGDFRTPFPHQVTGLNKAVANIRYGLFDEPGCGKTLPAQAMGMYYNLLGNQAVVIMPPVLLEQFEESLHLNFEGSERFFSCHILNQSPKERDVLYSEWNRTSWPDFLLVSYQMFLKLRHMFKEAKYSVLIADESHALKNPSSKIHKSVAEYVGFEGEEQAALLLMTGTPSTNTLIDLYGSIRLLTPRKYASKKSFERQHCIYIQEGDWLKLIGYRNKDLLRINLYSRARRIKKDQVFDLDKPIIQEIPIVLDGKHRRLYEKLVRERIVEMDGKLITALNQQSLRMKCLRIVTTPELFTDAKIKNTVTDTVEELLESLGASPTEKVILFANFRESVESLERRFKHLNPAVIYGKTTDRDVQRRKFLHDDTCSLLIANSQSAGAGLNLQSVCRYAIFVEPTSVPGIFKQASERIDRPGQKHVVGIYIIKALGTSSPALTANMLGKESETKFVMNDATSLMDSLLDKAA